MPKLVIEEGEQHRVFELFDEEATLGRGAANAIQVADARASKHHAVIRRVHGRLKLVDLESRYGTRVNGEYRNQRWLEAGDVVTIGELRLVYEAGGAAPAPAPARPAAAQAPAVPTVHATRSAHTPLGTRGAPVRARRERGEDDEDRPPRVVARRKDNSLAIAVLVGSCLIGAVVILFMLLGSRGTPNAAVLAEGKRIAKTGALAEAVKYLQDHGDPSDVDGYRSVAVEIKSMQETIADESRSNREQEAIDAMGTIQRGIAQRHQTNKSDVDFGRELLAWLEKYAGTIKAADLEHNTAAPFPALREMMAKARAK